MTGTSTRSTTMTNPNNRPRWAIPAVLWWSVLLTAILATVGIALVMNSHLWIGLLLIVVGLVSAPILVRIVMGKDQR